MTPPEPLPQFVDRFLSRTAMGVATMATTYALGAALFFLDGELATWVDRLQGALAILAVIIVLPTFLRFVVMRRKGQCREVESGGFISEVFQKACARGFTATFVAMMLMEPLSKKITMTLPPSFYLSVALAISLGVFGVSFFSLTRVDDELDNEEPGP